MENPVELSVSVKIIRQRLNNDEHKCKVEFKAAASYFSWGWCVIVLGWLFPPPPSVRSSMDPLFTVPGSHLARVL